MRPRVAILLCVALGGLSFGQPSARPRTSDSTPSQPQEPSLTYDQLITSGYDLLKTARIGEAYLAATRAALKDPNRFEAYALAALALHLKDADPEAKSFIDKALGRVPEQKRAEVLKIADLIKPGAAGTSIDTPDARRKMDALRIIIEEADKASGARDRQKLLDEFLDKSEPFVREHPSQVEVWSLRAAAAIELDDAPAGWQAGRRLLEFEQAHSLDPKTRRLMAMLERKGWLEKNPAFDYYKLLEELDQKIVTIGHQKSRQGNFAVEEALISSGFNASGCGNVNLQRTSTYRGADGSSKTEVVDFYPMPGDTKFEAKVQTVLGSYKLFVSPYMLGDPILTGKDEQRYSPESPDFKVLLSSDHAEPLQSLANTLMKMHKACVPLIQEWTRQEVITSIPVR